MNKADRVLILYHRLLRGERVTKRLFMDEFSVGRRSFDRYIESVRLMLSETFASHELLYDATDHSYYLSGIKNEKLRGMNVLPLMLLLFESHACAKVRNSLEELRENFDLEKAVGYFLSGKLTEWLEDRYYEDEAEALDAIDKDAPDLRARLCEALGVECADDEDLDVGALERLNEKKAILRQKTSDEAIIANADKTALTQEDFADLLDMDEPVIYLCGDSFNIPARVKNKKYIGVLGTPTISIKANSQEDWDAKGIVFENVRLPWGKKETIKSEETKPCPKCGADNAATAKFCNSCGASMDAQESSSGTMWVVPKTQMKAMFASTFKDDLEELGVDANDTFLMIAWRDVTSTKFTQEQKTLALSLICDDKYAEEDLLQLRISENMRTGWAFTKDSFCIRDLEHDDAIITAYESALLDNTYYFNWTSEGTGNAIAYTNMLGTRTTAICISNCLKNMKALFSKKKK